MYRIHRISFIAFSSLFLAAVLAAKAPAAEPAADLETTALAVQIMMQAFRAGDYETVETLFGKLPLENKKQFLKEALEFSDISNCPEGIVENTIMDSKWCGAIVLHEKPDHIPVIIELFDNYASEKTAQTQLLGRLAASLFDTPESAAKSVTKIAVVPAPATFQRYTKKRRQNTYSLRSLRLN